MAEYDVKDILAKDGIEHVDLRTEKSVVVTRLADVLAQNSKYKSWAKRVVDVSNSGLFQIATLVCNAKGGGNRKHFHPDCDEWWVVLSGKMEFEIGPKKEKYVTGPGDIVFARRGISHKVTVLSDEPAVRLSIGIDKMETIPADQEAGT